MTDSNDVGPRSGTRTIVGILFLVIACQFWLIFVKEINWDEFLHFGQIYELANGQLRRSLQTLHTRLFGWTALISQDIIVQIQAARVAMLACALLTTTCVVVLARRLADSQTALFCGLAYLTAGYVFTNAFTYRPDPVAAAALMGALCVFAMGTLSWKRAVLAGVLIGLAGALTIKSIFYLPCFAAIAWLHWIRQGGQKSKDLLLFCLMAVLAFSSFAMIVGLHGAGLPASGNQASNLGKSMDSFVQFATFEKIHHVFRQIIVSPLVVLSLVMLPFAARKLPKESKYLLIGLTGPLLCLLFYRNTFPYFFVFLLPPICVAIAPVLAKLIKRFGQALIVVLALFGPVLLLMQEPFGTLERQRATINEVERLFPDPTPYLSYSSYVPHYPRQFTSLLSGVALRRYWDERNGDITRDIEAGQIAFVIATGPALDAVYRSEGPASLLPERDVVALRTNFLQHSDTIFIAGHEICPKSAEQMVKIVRNGPHSLEGGDLVIKGRRLSDGDSMILQSGLNEVLYEQGPCVKLWALDQVPKLPKDFPSGPIFGGF
ncbi:ArnT family glycosyltransferase [Sphingorhabdus sp. Alg231-15]|uniref:ArnT family glycosyltransferase n=1 Tax=Sphingorhabdus sp. Alg231-15 TaxID=1922222 RepID=UPI00307B81F4